MVWANEGWQPGGCSLPSLSLEPFGENPSVVFVATSEPYGLIEATVSRL